MNFKTNRSVQFFFNLLIEELDVRNQFFISFRKPFGYMIMALSQILYGCGLIRVCMKTYVIKLTEREKRAL